LGYQKGEIRDIQKHKYVLDRLQMIDEYLAGNLKIFFGRRGGFKLMDRWVKRFFCLRSISRDWPYVVELWPV
jgi:hypothetical protein